MKSKRISFKTDIYLDFCFWAILPAININRHRRAKLQKLINTPVEIDLFNDNQIDLENKIEQTRAEIAALERGEYTGWVPPYYINEIKQWI